MLLVDHDEAEVRERREQRAASAHHHARRARADEVPLVVAFALAHARVHDGHHVAEAAAEACDGLRRQRDFGHEHARRAAGGQRGLDGLQVHLRLARAGHAVHEHHLARAALPRAVDGGECGGLPGRERRLGAGNEVARMRLERLPRLHASHAAAVLDDHDALLLKRFERRGHRAELGGQLRHAQLAALERRHDGRLLHGVLARLEVGKRRAGHHPAVVHLPHRGLFEPPVAALRPHHARHAARRREQAHARRQRRDVALREPLRARGALLVEIGAAHRAHDALELGGVEPRGPVAVGALVEGYDEPHRLPMPERHEHGAAHLHRLIARGGLVGDGVGVRRVERLRGNVEDNGCKFHAPSIPHGSRSRRPAGSSTHIAQETLWSSGAAHARRT